MSLSSSNSPLKKLAGETVIYGMSTILARAINFLLIYIYSRSLTRADLGVASEFWAYIAILQVVLILGLETGCFRFANKHHDSDAVFSNAFVLTSTLSFLLFIVLTIFSSRFASLLGYSGFAYMFVYMGLILLIDSSTAIIFAKMRFEQKAMKFAIFKSIKILSETIFNLILFYLIPIYFISHPQSYLANFVSVTPDYTYPIFATLLSCIVALLILMPDILKLKMKFDRGLSKMLLKYSIPIMIASLPGIVNDFIDRVLFRFCTPSGLSWESELGVFTANIKLATIMLLFIQMFRFAAEPFFFGKEKEKNSRELYAKIMTHFVAFSMFIFLGIMCYIDIIQLFLGKDFRQGADIIPVMLFSYALLGMNFNISMWYKLSGQTKFAVIITALGLPVTLAVNLIFMPIFSYHAAAWGHLSSYLVMMLISLYMGNRYYPIKYEWRRILFYIFSALLLYLIILMLPDMHILLKYLIHTFIIGIYVLLYFKKEKIVLWKLKL